MSRSLKKGPFIDFKLEKKKCWFSMNHQRSRSLKRGQDIQ